MRATRDVICHTTRRKECTIWHLWIAIASSYVRSGLLAVIVVWDSRMSPSSSLLCHISRSDPVQKLSVGKALPYQALSDLFDQETESGAKMDKYSGSLAKAINAIVCTFPKRTAAGLQSGRDFVIPDKQEQATDSSDFELVTWLVIKGDRL